MDDLSLVEVVEPSKNRHRDLAEDFLTAPQPALSALLDDCVEALALAIFHEDADHRIAVREERTIVVNDVGGGAVGEELKLAEDLPVNRRVR